MAHMGSYMGRYKEIEQIVQEGLTNKGTWRRWEAFLARQTLRKKDDEKVKGTRGRSEKLSDQASFTWVEPVFYLCV